MPALLLMGDDDRWVATGQSVRLASELRNAEVLVISYSGHLLYEENLAPFMRRRVCSWSGCPNPLRGPLETAEVCVDRRPGTGSALWFGGNLRQWAARG